MAKKGKDKKSKKNDAISFSIFSFAPPPPQVHPNEEQEDPINGKFEKSIELDEYGLHWR
jgi:hypothetical protein